MSDDTFRPPHGLGLKPDSPDRRDRALYRAVPNIDALPPTSFSLGIPATFPAIMDQGVIGACTGYSFVQIMHAIMKRDGHPRPFVGSPVAAYLWGREEGGYPQEDAGAEIRNVWKMGNKRGIVPLSNLKPRFSDVDLPDQQTYLFPPKSIWIKPVTAGNLADAERRQLVNYYKLFTLADVLKCLSEGYAVNIGITLFRSFYGNGGPRKIIPMPVQGERELGGHAVNIIDYDMPNRLLWCRNQWGPDAHEGGPDFAISFDYFNAYASDCWTGRLIEGGKVPKA
jgi:hypothetical protein